MTTEEYKFEVAWMRRLFATLIMDALHALCKGDRRAAEDAVWIASNKETVPDGITFRMACYGLRLNSRAFREALARYGPERMIYRMTAKFQAQCEREQRERLANELPSLLLWPSGQAPDWYDTEDWGRQKLSPDPSGKNTRSKIEARESREMPGNVSPDCPTDCPHPVSGRCPYRVLPSKKQATNCFFYRFTPRTGPVPGTDPQDLGANKTDLPIKSTDRPTGPQKQGTGHTPSP